MGAKRWIAQMLQSESNYSLPELNSVAIMLVEFMDTDTLRSS